MSCWSRMWLIWNLYMCKLLSPQANLTLNFMTVQTRKNRCTFNVKRKIKFGSFDYHQKNKLKVCTNNCELKQFDHDRKNKLNICTNPYQNYGIGKKNSTLLKHNWKQSKHKFFIPKSTWTWWQITKTKQNFTKL